MQDKVGDEFDGVISGVANFGVFVELSEVYVEGLVHITSLGNDYYHYDPVKHRLTGERTNEVLRLGDPVRVKVVRVDLDEARIDFELVGHEQVRRKKRGGKESAGKKGKKAKKGHKGKSGQKKTSRKKSSRKSSTKGKRSKQRASGRRR